MNFKIKLHSPGRVIFLRATENQNRIYKVIFDRYNEYNNSTVYYRDDSGKIQNLTWVSKREFLSRSMPKNHLAITSISEIDDKELIEIHTKPEGYV